MRVLIEGKEFIMVTGQQEDRLYHAFEVDTLLDLGASLENDGTLLPVLEEYEGDNEGYVVWLINHHIRN